MPDQPPPIAPQPDDAEMLSREARMVTGYRWWENNTDREPVSYAQAYYAGWKAGAEQNCDAAQAAQRRAEAERDDLAEERDDNRAVRREAEKHAMRYMKECNEARAQLAEAERRAAALAALLKRYARLWHYRRADALEAHWSGRDGDFRDCDQVICAEARVLLAAPAATAGGA